LTIADVDAAETPSRAARADVVTGSSARVSSE
jgi:hypothetical protein